MAQLGNIFLYRSSSNGSVLESILLVELGVNFPVNSSTAGSILENKAQAARSIQRINSSNIALQGWKILEL